MNYIDYEITQKTFFGSLDLNFAEQCGPEFMPDKNLLSLVDLIPEALLNRFLLNLTDNGLSFGRNPKVRLSTIFSITFMISGAEDENTMFAVLPVLDRETGEDLGEVLIDCNEREYSNVSIKNPEKFIERLSRPPSLRFKTNELAC